jgi:hypothetical protein
MVTLTHVVADDLECHLAHSTKDGHRFHGISGSHSTRRWAADLTDGFMESGLCCQVKACVAGGGFSHAFSGKFEPVGVVN